MRNPHKALEAINELTGSDFGLDMEFVVNENNPKNKTARLREAAKLITQIYCIAHAEVSHGCRHEDWEDIKTKILKHDRS